MAAELKKPATITVWAWTPGTDKAVEMFEKEYPNIKVKLQNVGQGPPHYRKLRTVLKSGKGLPTSVTWSSSTSRASRSPRACST
jgi:multiple sugar transport system substrate-binding protein